MLAALGPGFLRLVCGALSVASTAILCTGAAAVALAVAVALGEGGAMGIAVAVLVLAAVSDGCDSAISTVAIFVVASVFFPVAVAAGYDIDPAALLAGLFDAARDPVAFLRAGSECVFDLVLALLEALARLARSLGE